MRLIIAGVFLLSLVLSLSGETANASFNSVVTIQSVEIKRETGEWVTVIRPDKKADLSSPEMRVAFFNNKGRIPEGVYKNLRISVSEEEKGRSNFNAIGTPGTPSRVYAKKDFAEPLAVRKGSFIGVKVALFFPDALQASPSIPKKSEGFMGSRQALSPKSVDEVTITVDSHILTLKGWELECGS